MVWYWMFSYDLDKPMNSKGQQKVMLLFAEETAYFW